jgi:hypothetical protein
MRSHASLARLVIRGTRRGPRAFAVFAGLVSLFGACSPSLSVRTGWDPHADFASYRTWMWKADGSIEDVELERVARGAVAHELEAHGLEEVADSARASLLCVVHARVSPRRRLESEWSSGMGPYGGGWGYDDQVEHEVPVGTMIVELVDPDRKEVVWRGRANDVIRVDRSREEREQKLAAVVRQMFADYPPAPDAVPEASTAAR